MSKKVTYVLMTQQGNPLDVCTSMRTLRKATDHWMKVYPKAVLYWQSYYANKVEGIDGWEWAYIPKSARPYRLAVGGGDVPDPKFRGINLVGVRFTNDLQERRFQKELDEIDRRNGVM
jgi:hypothetical protein